MGCCSSKDDVGGGNGGRGPSDFTDLADVAEREKRGGGADRQEPAPVRGGKQQQQQQMATMQKLSRYDTGKADNNSAPPQPVDDRRPIAAGNNEVVAGAGLAALGVHTGGAITGVQEPAVQLKAATGPRSRIVEAKLTSDSNKARQQQTTSPPPPAPAQPAQPRSITANDTHHITLEASGGDSNRRSNREESKMAAELTSKLASLIAVKGDGEAEPGEEEDEEARNIKALRKMKEELKHEVQAPKAGFGLDPEKGSDEVEETPKGPPPNSPGVEDLAPGGAIETIEPIEEAVVQSLDITTSGDPTPMKAKMMPQSSRYADHFPSAEWFADHSAKRPSQVTWWQNKEQLWITLKIVDPEEIRCQMESRTLLTFECQSNGERIAVHFDLLEDVHQEIECKPSKTDVQICASKANAGMWPRKLIKGDRKRYLALDWIDYDVSRSADDDESSDEEDGGEGEGEQNHNNHGGGLEEEDGKLEFHFQENEQ